MEASGLSGVRRLMHTYHWCVNPCASMLLACVRGRVFQPDWKVNQAQKGGCSLEGRTQAQSPPPHGQLGGNIGQVESVGQCVIGATSEQGLGRAPGR